MRAIELHNLTSSQAKTMVAAPNVFRVQDGPAAATPLILFHDGGGTVFSYYFIDNVHRTVYGVANPRLESGRPWKGGVQEMAKEYCALVRQCVPSGEVILGGTSISLLSLVKRP